MVAFTFLDVFEDFAATAPQARLGTLLIIDANHFNDSYGHLNGDQALLQISSAIRRDDIVGRIGGEEFGAILIAASRDDAIEIAERIRARKSRTRR